MSVNIQTSSGLKKLADKTTEKNIKKALGYLPLNPDNVITLVSDSDIISIEDINGNIALKVDNDGLTVSTLNIKSSLIIPNNIISDSDTFSIEDLYGNINFKVSNNGLETTSLHLNDNIYLDDSIIDITDNIGNIILKLSDSGITTTSMNLNILNSSGIVSSNITNAGLIKSEYLECSKSIIAEIFSVKTASIENLNISESIETSDIEVKGELNTSSITSDSDSFELMDSNGNTTFKVDQEALYATDIYSNGELVATQNYVLSVISGTTPVSRATTQLSTFFTNNNSTMSRVDKSQYILSPVICYGGEHYHSLPFQKFSGETSITEVFTINESDITLQAYITIYFNGIYFEISNIRSCKPLEFVTASESDWRYGYDFTIPYIYAIPLS